jgi:hypothetical protein
MSLSQADRETLSKLTNLLQEESIKILQGTEPDILDQIAISQTAIDQRSMSNLGKQYHSAILRAYDAYRLERCYHAPSAETER